MFLSFFDCNFCILNFQHKKKSHFPWNSVNSVFSPNSMKFFCFPYRVENWGLYYNTVSLFHSIEMQAQQVSQDCPQRSDAGHWGCVQTHPAKQRSLHLVWRRRHCLSHWRQRRQNSEFSCNHYLAISLIQGQIQDFHLGGAQKIMCPHAHNERVTELTIGLGLF